MNFNAINSKIYKMTDLPYFKFFPSEWLTGNINFESYSTKGAFMDLVCYYWSKECKTTRAQAKRITGREWQNIVHSGVVKVENEELSITFLDIQFKERKANYIKAVESGRKGGLKKAENQKNKEYQNNNLLKVQPEVLKLLNNGK